MKRSPQARRRQRHKRQLNYYRNGYHQMLEVVGADTAFRALLGALLLKPSDFEVKHDLHGPLLLATGHPDLKPLLIQRVRELLERRPSDNEICAELTAEAERLGLEY